MSLHAAAAAALAEWVAPNAEQEALRQTYVDLLAREPEGMSRAAAPDHITCGALVVDEAAEHVLMNLHGKAGIWVAFGGHCEPDDESPLAAATRELVEESGIAAGDLSVDPEIAQLDIHPVDFCRAEADSEPRSVRHLDIRFVARVARDAVHQASEESLDVRWFPIDDAPTTEASMLDLMRIARQRFS